MGKQERDDGLVLLFRFRRGEDNWQTKLVGAAILMRKKQWKRCFVNQNEGYSVMDSWIIGTGFSGGS